MIAVVRLEWLQVKASKERFEEEVKLVRAESSCVGRTFLYLGKQWRLLGAAFNEEIGEATMKRAVRALCYCQETASSVSQLWRTSGTLSCSNGSSIIYKLGKSGRNNIFSAGREYKQYFVGQYTQIHIKFMIDTNSEQYWSSKFDNG